MLRAVQQRRPSARNTLDSARIPRASKLLICGLLQKGRVLAQDGVAPSDPWTLLAISVALGGVAFGACLLPGLRATRIDSLIALRDS